MIAADSFALNDVDGHAYAHTEQVPRELQDHVVEPARSCPEQAIIVSADTDPPLQQNSSRTGGV